MFVIHAVICIEFKNTWKEIIHCLRIHIHVARVQKHSWYQLSWGYTNVVQSLSHAQLFATPWTAARQVSLSFTISWSLLKLMVIELVMPSNRLVLCGPLLLLPSVFPSIRVFSSESALHIRWPNTGASAPSNEYSGLISFRITWCGLLAVQVPLKSLLQHHS